MTSEPTASGHAPRASATPLFRPEVALARRGRWLGTVTLEQPAGMRALVVAVALIGALLLALLVLGSWTPRVPVSGHLVLEEGRRLARLKVPEAAVRHLAVGDALALEFDEQSVAAPGRIIAIVPGELARRQRWFRVDVLAEAGAAAAGQGVRAEITGERQPLYRWMFGHRKPRGSE